eukprot:9941499-Prorocentrum_lima.AAC.1
MHTTGLSAIAAPILDDYECIAGGRNRPAAGDPRLSLSWKHSRHQMDAMLYADDIALCLAQ